MTTSTIPFGFASVAVSAALAAVSISYGGVPVYRPMAVTVGTRRAPEIAGEKVKKTRFLSQGYRGVLTHKY